MLLVEARGTLSLHNTVMATANTIMASSDSDAGWAFVKTDSDGKKFTAQVAEVRELVKDRAGWRGGLGGL